MSVAFGTVSFPNTYVNILLTVSVTPLTSETGLDTSLIIYPITFPLT